MPTGADDRPSAHGSPLRPKADFTGLAGVVHLAAAGETPYLASHAAVVARFAADKSAGMAGRKRLVARTGRTAAAVADLLGVHADEVGFPLNVAQAVNMVARVVAGQGPGNVVMCAWEYPSMLYPWTRLAETELRLIRRDDCLGALPAIEAAVDSSTRAIVVSHVSYFTGERVDLAGYRQVADRAGALLIVDASHSLGVLPVDARLADFLFSCCYKWLLGVHGAAVAFCNRDRQPGWSPVEVGWTSVQWQDSRSRSAEIALVDDGRIFELGNPALLSVAILGNALDYLRAAGSTAIERHVLALGETFGAELRKLGLPMLTPQEEPRRGASIVFGVEDEEFWCDGLADAGILAWVGEGRVRLSPFVYTGWSDVTAALRAITRLARGQSPADGKDH